MAEPRAHPLFEQTRRALDGLRDVPAAHDLAMRLALVWSREPLGVGLGGDDLAARTELINAMCGSPLLAPRAPGCAPIAAERARLAPTFEQRDRARTVLLELRAQIAAIEAELPECAAASAAVVD